MKKDKFIIYGFMMVFTALVCLLTFDIQIELNAQRVIKKEKIKGHALIVSDNKITKYVANAQVINDSSTLVLNEILSSDDIKKVTEEEKKEEPSPAPAPVPVNNGVATPGYAWPTAAGWYISCNYGYRYHPITGRYEFHHALDITGPGMGSWIYSANNGIIHSKGWSSSYGYHYIINHNNGYYTLYAHLQGFASGIERGSYVTKGQLIGYMGMTGSATGPHLHYEAWVGVPWSGGYQINPWSLY
jgi:murein DD-endopeptidase MepM/ murein hydrolase activator NlpD